MNCYGCCWVCRRARRPLVSSRSICAPISDADPLDEHQLPHRFARRLIRAAVEQCAELRRNACALRRAVRSSKASSASTFFAARVFDALRATPSAASGTPAPSPCCSPRRRRCRAAAADRRALAAGRAASDTPRWRASPIASRCALRVAGRREAVRMHLRLHRAVGVDRALPASSANARGRSNRSKWLSFSEPSDRRSVQEQRSACMSSTGTQTKRPCRPRSSERFAQ